MKAKKLLSWLCALLMASGSVSPLVPMISVAADEESEEYYGGKVIVKGMEAEDPVDHDPAMDASIMVNDVSRISTISVTVRDTYGTGEIDGYSDGWGYFYGNDTSTDNGDGTVTYTITRNFYTNSTFQFWYDDYTDWSSDTNVPAVITAFELLDSSGSSLYSWKEGDMFFTKRPKDAVVDKVGDTAVFTAAAAGEGSVSYAWYYRDGESSEWKKTSVAKDTYSIAVTAARNGRQMYCEATDSKGNTVSSDVVTMTVREPSITTQPEAAVAAKEGDSVTFTVAAEGSGISYAWYYSDDNGSTWKKTSSTSPSYTIAVTAARAGRRMYCQVTDELGRSVNSDAVSMTIDNYVKTGVIWDGFEPTLNYTAPVKIKDLGLGGYHFDGSKKLVVFYSMDGANPMYGSTNNYSCTLRIYGGLDEENCFKNDYRSYDQIREYTEDGNGNYYYKPKRIYSEVVIGESIDGYDLKELLNGLSVGGYNVMVEGVGIYDADYEVTGNEVPDHSDQRILITKQPNDSSDLQPGDTASFSVAAQGSGLKYRWEYSDDYGTTWKQTSVTKPEYSTAATLARDGRSFRCAITNSYGTTVYSRNCTLELYYIYWRNYPSYSSYVDTLGDSITLKAKTNLEENVTYAWWYSDDNGETWKKTSVTTPEYTIAVTKARVGRRMKCVATAWGEKVVEGSAVTLGVNYPNVTKDPENQTVTKSGDNVTFSVEAAGSNIAYAWWYSDDNGETWKKTSVTTPEYTIAVTAARSGRLMKCIVTDELGRSDESGSAVMRYYDPAQNDKDFIWKGSFKTGSGENLLRISGDDAAKILGSDYAFDGSKKIVVYYTGYNEDDTKNNSYAGLTGIYGQADSYDSDRSRFVSGDSYKYENIYDYNYFESCYDVINRFYRYIGKNSYASDELWSDAKSLLTDGLTLTGRNIVIEGIAVFDSDFPIFGDELEERYQSDSFFVYEGPEDRYAKRYNEDVTFNVKAIGNGIKYRWYYSDNSGETWTRTGVTTSSYTIAVTAARVGRMMRCEVTSAAGETLTTGSGTMYLAPIYINSNIWSTSVSEPGETAALSIEASGEGLKYAWYYSDDKGETWKKTSVTTPEYSIAVTNAREGRQMKCIITDVNGQTRESYTATLSIDRPYFSEDLTSAVVENVGDIAEFSVKFTGKDPTYAWYYSDDNGETWKKTSVTTDTYSIAVTKARNGRLMKCVATDKFGYSLESQASMSIAAPEFTSQPETCIVAKAGDKATFTASAKGSGLTYAWYYSNDNGENWTKTASTSDTYSIAVTAQRNGRIMCCIVTDALGQTKVSNVAFMGIAASSDLKWYGAKSISNSEEDGKLSLNDLGLSGYKFDGSKKLVLFHTAGNKYFNYSSSYYYRDMYLYGGTDSIYNNWTYDYNGYTSRKVTSTADGTDINAVVPYQRYTEIVLDESTKALADGLTVSGYYYTLNGVAVCDTDKVIIGNELGGHPYMTELMILRQPLDKMVYKEGKKAVFTFDAQGDGLTYRWSYSDDQGKTWKKTSVTDAAYSIAVTKARNGRMMKCTVTDKYGNTVETEPAAMSIAGDISFVKSIPPTDTDTDYIYARPYENTRLSGIDGLTIPAEGLTVKLTLDWGETSAEDESGCFSLTPVVARSYFSDLGQLQNNKTYILGVPTSGELTYSEELGRQVNADGEPVDYYMDSYGTIYVENNSVKEITLTLAPELAADIKDSMSGLMTYYGGYYRAGINFYTNGSAQITDIQYSADVALVEDAVIAITEQPKSVRVEKAGDTATFTVTAEGKDLSYRWFYSDSSTGWEWKKTSVTANTYSIAVTEARNDRAMKCQVTNKYGVTVDSNSVSMNIRVKLTKAAVHLNFPEEDDGYCYIYAYGNGDTDSCEWYISTDNGKSWSVYKDVQSSRFEYGVNDETIGTQFYAVLSNSFGETATTPVAIIKDYPKPVIVSQPDEIVYVEDYGAAALLKYVGSGIGVAFSGEIEYSNGDYSYVDDKSSSEFDDSFESEVSEDVMNVSVTLTEERQEANVFMWAYDSVGRGLTLAPVIVRVAPKPAIVTQPKDVKVAKEGDSATFTVSAEGIDLTYAWSYSDDGGKTWKKTSVTAASYKIAVTSARNGRMMKCTVTDKLGRSVDSAAAAMSF